MTTYAVERTFSPPITAEQFTAAGAVLGPCIAARDIQWVGSNFAADGSRSLCLFEAADAERLREANHVAGIAFDKVYAVNVYKP
jgi:hypothetical protein